MKNYGRLLVFMGATMAILACAPRSTYSQTQYYAAPDGSSQGDGSREHPWDLGTALDGKHVSPGTTIWLRGGTYLGPFTSYLTGSENAVITVRQAPGERAIITDNRARAASGTLNVYGGWTTYQDFEVTNINPQRAASPVFVPSGRADTFRPEGIFVEAPHTKFINLVIHDAGFGFGFWKEAVDSEIYGCLIFNNGTQNVIGTDTRHGHAIYTQNDTGTKLIRDNIMFDQFGFGLHIWSSPDNIRGYEAVGNVIFDSGILTAKDNRFANVIIDGAARFIADRITLRNNYTYESPGQKLRGNIQDASICLECDTTSEHGSAWVEDNVFVGQSPIAIGPWRSMTFTGNTVVGFNGLIALKPPKDPAGLRWDQNRYFGTTFNNDPQGFFGYTTGKADFNGWQSKSGLDRQSQFTKGRPSGVWTFVRPNEYQPGRGMVIIYNWDRHDTVDVDVSSILSVGKRFEVRNAEDYLGAPVFTGTYDGNKLRLPMTGLRVAAPLGWKFTPDSTAPDFAVFVIDSRVAASAAPLLSSGDLGLFVGNYVSDSPRASINIVLENGALAAIVTSDPRTPKLPLVQESPTRFAGQGDSGPVTFDFELAQGKVARLTLSDTRNSVSLRPSRP